MTQPPFLTEEARRGVLEQKFPESTVEIEKTHIINFAAAIRDDNPLWNDERAARKSRFGGLIAPPTFTRFVGSAARATGRGQYPLPGTVQVDGGTEWEYFGPIRPGDVITSHRKVTDVRERAGSVGPLIFIVVASTYVNQFGETVATQQSTAIRYDATAVNSSAPEPVDQTEPTSEATSIGSPHHEHQLHWEDVAEGDEIPPLIRTTSTQDLVKYAGASRDFSEIHYDKDFALSVGLPGVILHGALKAAYLGKLVTDWIGEYGDLKKLGCQHRGMDMPGNTTICGGRVKSKSASGDEHLVDCEIWLEDARGQKTVPGWATVALPTKGLVS